MNVPGGLRIAEPALDLAIAAAIASSYRDRPLDPHTALIGEVGLNGEVRSVAHLERRLNEAARHGFKRALVPRAALRNLPCVPGIEPEGVAAVNDPRIIG